MPWIPPELPVDPDANAQRIIEGLVDRLEGWEPYEGDPLVAFAGELGREWADLAAFALQCIETAAAGVGETVYAVPALQAEPATARVELTLSAADVLGPDFTVNGTTDTGVEVALALTETVSLPIGPTEVTMTALVAGEDGNGIPVGNVVITTATATVVSAVVVNASEGGRDAETREQYLDRLSDTLATLRFGGVRAEDLAALSRSVPGVHRAFGVDLHNPADPGVPSERTATVFPVDDAGQPVDAGVKADLDNYLQGLREVNFIVHVADPTYTAITVAYAAIADAGTTPTVVEAEINAALGRYLSPANWGSTSEDPQAWLPSPMVRFLDVARVIGSVPGVTYVDELLINGGTSDVALAGAAPLPAANATISGTVS